MILVLNCGSQSIKWKLFDKKLKVVNEKQIDVLDPKEFRKILTKELKNINSFSEEINFVGHRVVHGGEEFKKPTIIDGRNIEKLEAFNKLAPLHNPYNIMGIKTALKIFEKAKQVAVFDTEFYSSISEKAYIYPLPEDIRKKFGFRRFGFHGISHEYASKEATGKSFNTKKIISCHLGGGSSITAINKGKAVDTSMGFTPLEGLLMMTRCGDIDPGIILELVKNYSLNRVKKILNKESGLKSICGESEMLKILENIKKGNEKSELALDIFVYRIQKYIGAYVSVLKGCDVLVFTGTIGFRSKKIRNMITNNIPFLKGVKIIEIEPNEELAIAKKICNE